MSNWYFINVMIRRSERLKEKAKRAKAEERLRVLQEKWRRQDEEMLQARQERMRIGKEIEIYIREELKWEMPFLVKPTDTILSIKKKLMRYVGYEPQYQVLSIAGIELEDRFTIEYYKGLIFDGSTLVFTTRGGFTLGSLTPRRFRFGGGGEPRPTTRVEPGTFGFGGGGVGKKAVFHV